MDNYIALAITRSQDQLHYGSNAIMIGIYDVSSLVNEDK